MSRRNLMWAEAAGGAAGLVLMPNTLRWNLEDNLATTVVIGSEVNGVMNGGNTADVAATLANGLPGFHFNGSSQYVSVAIPALWPHAITQLWTKYAGNPVLDGSPSSTGFGQVVAKPGGGWYWFDCQGGGVFRWTSVNLITWTNKTSVLAGGGAGKWDKTIGVVSVATKPDTSWVMLYRGFDDTTYRIGLATSADGTTWARKDNGGVNDGLFPQFGNNFDPTTIMLIGTTYYVYVNGDPNHGTQNVYTSTDDFATFSVAASNLLPDIGDGGKFCCSVFARGGYYYMLLPHDVVMAGAALYDHRIGLFRSASPLFPSASTEYLGCAVVNDQTYDAQYLDTPSVPMTDVYRTTYPAEFGDTLHMLYNGRPVAGLFKIDLASRSISGLSALNPAVGQLYGQPWSIECWVQFDALTDTMPFFSIGNSRNDGSPQQLWRIATSGADKVVALFLAAGYRNTTLPLAINTPYHIIVTDNMTTTTVYINKIQVGAFAQRSTNKHISNFYLGSGFNGYVDGYFGRAFKIYPRCLTAAEVGRM